MTEVAEALRTAAGAAFAGEPIAFAYLFGSHATGTATERSDVDVAVHLQPDATTDQTAGLGLRLAGSTPTSPSCSPKPLGFATFWSISTPTSTITAS
ncbi:hypothetical protein BH20ACT3_BH20ACT3_06560 [soil metagenome]